MRASTAFKRLLCLRGASIVDVSFSGEGVIVSVKLRRRRRVCAVCGQTGRCLAIHDRRVKRWRHLDLGSTRCIIECELRRLRCPDCQIVRLEPVPWPGRAPITRATSKTLSHGWRSRWPRPRSRGCCGSAGTPSG
ncbi:MAG: transposase family protein [Actinobacteria bacterium]|nr:transposase family protein [Actinomycetota bacterium]